MSPCEKFELTHDPITGFPIEADAPRQPIDPATYPTDNLTTRKAKAIIRRHMKGIPDAQGS